jgi:Uma2 family endonuclease
LDLGLSPEQFALVCAANPDAVLELAADGRLIDMPPTGGVTSRPNTHLLTRLQIWAERQGDLVVVTTVPLVSVLPAGRLRDLPRCVHCAPGALAGLTPGARRGSPLCPDFVVELVSTSDVGPLCAKALRQKMADYIAKWCPARLVAVP